MSDFTNAKSVLSVSLDCDPTTRFLKVFCFNNNAKRWKAIRQRHRGQLQIHHRSESTHLRKTVQTKTVSHECCNAGFRQTAIFICLQSQYTDANWSTSTKSGPWSLCFAVLFDDIQYMRAHTLPQWLSDWTHKHSSLTHHMTESGTYTITQNKAIEIYH